MSARGDVEFDDGRIAGTQDEISPEKRALLVGILNSDIKITKRQREYVELVLEHGTGGAAARVAGVTRGAVNDSIKAVIYKAQRKGYSPDHDMTRPAPDTHFVKGVSTYYNKDGEVGGQWVKTQIEQEDKLKQVKMFAEALCAEAEGRAKRKKAPKLKAKDKDLLSIYPMGDPHLGMYAWWEETGEDFDVDIAVHDLTTATARLVDVSPSSEHAIVLNLGDFFHTDNSSNMTMRSGNILDVDTRWSRVMRMGETAMVHCIDLALEKHKYVHVRNCIGNHDDHTSQALSLILAAYYRNEPRVKVDISPNLFWYYRFGKALIGSTHGHTVKAPELANIMAHDKPKDWGETEFRYWYLGHFHTQRVHEVGSVVIEYFRTLASRDAWTHSSGYRSGRDMNSIIIHREWGQIERHRADILMVKA